MLIFEKKQKIFKEGKISACLEQSGTLVEELAKSGYSWRKLNNFADGANQAKLVILYQHTIYL